MKSIAGKVFGKKKSPAGSPAAPSGQQDLPHLLSPHRNSFEAPPQRKENRALTLTRQLNESELTPRALMQKMQKETYEMKQANAEMQKQLKEAKDAQNKGSAKEKGFLGKWQTESKSKLPCKSLGYFLAEKSWIFSDIEPWAATTLVREKLEKQAVLKGSSPVLLHLQNIPVVDGLKTFKSKLGSMRGLDEDAFVKIVSQSYPQAAVSAEMTDSIAEIITSDAVNVFGFMDSHATKELSIGEWAGAMADFFQGTQEEKARALFDLLDEHSKGWLSNEELQHYLIAPVKAMTPSEASPLVPLLVRLCADQIMESASCTDKSKICCQDFVQWQSKHNEIDFLAKFVEEDVFKGYLHWAEASSDFVEL